MGMRGGTGGAIFLSVCCVRFLWRKRKSERERRGGEDNSYTISSPKTEQRIAVRPASGLTTELQITLGCTFPLQDTLRVDRGLGIARYGFPVICMDLPALRNSANRPKDSHVGS